MNMVVWRLSRAIWMRLFELINKCKRRNLIVLLLGWWWIEEGVYFTDLVDLMVVKRRNWRRFWMVERIEVSNDVTLILVNTINETQLCALCKYHKIVRAFNIEVPVPYTTAHICNSISTYIIFGIFESDSIPFLFPQDFIFTTLHISFAASWQFCPCIRVR
jgi:hypothetical protein